MCHSLGANDTGASDVLALPREERIDARVKLACLVIFAIAALHAHTAASLAICCIVAAAMGAAARMRPRDVALVLRPLAVILAVTAIMQVLSIREGQVLAQWGPIMVTTGALASIARMVIGLLCIMVASVAFMRCTSSEQIARAFAWLLAPLRRMGVRTDGLLFSLSVAFRFASVLVGEFGQLKRAQMARGAMFDGTVRQRLAAYARLFAPLIRSSFRKADNLADAALSRGFGAPGRRTNLHRGCFGWPEALCLAMMCAVAIAVVLL